MTVAEGFLGQRLLVLPRPRVRAALAEPITSRMLVTDSGYFPQAQAHERERLNGIDQAIVLVCTRGTGWARMGGVQHPVAAGQVVVIPPGVPHAYGSDRDDPWTLWWLHAAGLDVPGFLTAAGFTSAAPVRELTDSYRAVALIEEIVASMERDTTRGSLVASAGAAWHLLALLSVENPLGVRGSVVENARVFLRNHLTERVSVADLASMAGLSPSHFSYLFKQQVGSPVLHYQTQLRMARARELLDTTDQQVSLIASQVGYDDAFYFSRLFRSVHGTTPLRYRALHKG